MPIVQENRPYQRILLSDDSEAKLEAQGFEPLFSSNVSAAAQRGKDLIIRFHNGSIYKYPEQGKNYLQLVAASSHGKWVWRFLIRPQVAYAKIGSLPLPEDTLETDDEITLPRIATYEVRAIVPKDHMTTGELPQIRIVPIVKASDIATTTPTGIVAKPVITLSTMASSVTKVPFFKTNKTWFKFDKDKKLFVLTDKAPDEAIKSYNKYLDGVKETK